MNDESEQTENYVERLTNDLERLLRYASTAKDVDIPDEVLKEATNALQASKSAFSEDQSLSEQAELLLFKSIDVLSPKVYPATVISLEIAELMEVGSKVGSARQQKIRIRVKELVAAWNLAALLALLMAFAMTAFKAADKSLPSNLQVLVSISDVANPMVLGFLGACAFILRRILQGLASQTFVLREGTTYRLRSILGIILGYMIPRIVADVSGKQIGFLSSLAIPFLAGYAVEPMFAALDNIVLTIRDAVSRDPTVGGKVK